MEKKSNLNKILLIPIFAVLFLNLAIAGYIGYSAYIQGHSDRPLVMTLAESGTNTLSLSSMFGGDTIKFTTLSENKNNRTYDVYNSMFVAELDSVWESSDVDSFYFEDPRYGTGVPGEVSKSCIFHIRSDGTTTPFSSIDAESTKVVRLMYDSDCDGVMAKYTHGSKSMIQNNIEIRTSPTWEDGDFSIKVCQPFDLIKGCE